MATKTTATKTTKTAAKKVVKTARKVDSKKLDAALKAAQGPVITKKPAAKKAGKPVAKSEVKPARTGSKMEIASAIYLKMKGQPRADILAKFISEAKLTKAGANTYVALLRKKHG